MKTKFFSLLYGLILCFLYACTAELEVNNSNGDINSLTVPSGFDWKTSKDVNFNIRVRDIRFGDAIHVIAIYTSDPSSTGTSPIAKGAATLSSPFYTKISLGSSVKELYIVKTAPDGTKLSEKVTIDASLYVTLSMGSNTAGRIAVPDDIKTVGLTLDNTNIDCNAGCEVSINEKTAEKTIDIANKTVCLIGSNYSVTIKNSDNGTLKVCGTNITINNLSVQNTSKTTLIVTSTGSAILNSGSWDASQSLIQNFGSLTFSNKLTLGGQLQNIGKLNLKKGLESKVNSKITNQGSILNEGTLVVAGAMTNEGEMKSLLDILLNASGETITNNGRFTGIGKLILSGSTIFTNNNYMTVKDMLLNNSVVVNNKCQMIVTNNLDINKMLNNNSYVFVGNQTRLNATGSVNLYYGALFITSTLSTFDGKITGIGVSEYSLFRVLTASTNLNSGSSYKLVGRVQFAEPSGSLDKKFLDEDAVSTTGTGIYIPKTECNEGNGKVIVTLKDSDKDGVIDVVDDFPSDANKAFKNTSLPSTVAFEDQWPSMGDYDMNDAVLSCSYQIITNSSNKVVRIQGDYTLHAAGGSYENGGGIQFNLLKSKSKNFSSSSGATLEAGQDSVVVVLYQNSGKELGIWNTLPSQSIVPPKTYNFSFDVNDGPLIRYFGIGNYNPFIWNNSSNYGRGFETHLLGKYPTKLADTKYFGTANDNSNVANGRYYVTTKGLPWAIEVSTDNFKYPTERSTITSAYLYFATWVTSGGVSRTDWYSNKQAGYRYTPFIFNPD